MEQTLLERLLNLSRHIAETPRIASPLEYAIGEAIELVGAEYGYIVLMDENGALRFEVQCARTGEPIHDPEISHSILRQVISTRQPLIVYDALNDPDWGNSASVHILKLRSVVCVPLITCGRVIGAIYLDNRKRHRIFEQAVLVPLGIIANQLALSIENAHLSDQLAALSTHAAQDVDIDPAQMERQWRDAIAVNQQRTMLLTTIAHDLRSAFSVSIMSLHLLKDGICGILNAEQTLWLEKGIDAANYALRLTTDIFDLAKSEQGALTLFFETVAPESLLHMVHDASAGLSHAEAVTLQLDIPAELPAIICDPTRIQQVLINLLSNATKFTTTGTITLYAEHHPEHGELLIGVRDTGEGITPGDMEKLFQPFQLIDRNRSRRRSSTGLGLAICRSLIEIHGGRIWAESTPGVGSDFKFALPLVSQQAPDDTLEYRFELNDKAPCYPEAA